MITMKKETEYLEIKDKYKAGNLTITLPQMRVCQIWISNQGNVSRTLATYKEVYGIELKRPEVERWLEYPQVKEYLEDLIDDLKIATCETKEKWIADAVRFRDGKKEGNEMTPAMHKMIGQVKGYLSGDGAKIDLNQEIRVVQADGSQ